MPELLILLKGIGVATRSVAVFSLLWFVVLYVFGIAFRQLTIGAEVGELYFSTVPVSMNTLLFDGIFRQNQDIIDDLCAFNPAFWPAMVFFIALAALTIMYMLIGVLVDTITAIASAEKEGVIVSSVAERLRHEFIKLGRPLETPITKYEFSQLLQTTEIVKIVMDIGVDVVVLMDMIDIIYDDPTKSVVGLTFEQYVECVLNMRGNNPATVKDSKEQLRVLKRIITDTHKGTSSDVVIEVKKLRDEMWELHAATMKKLAEAIGDMEDEELLESIDGDDHDDDEVGVSFSKGFAVEHIEPDEVSDLE